MDLTPLDVRYQEFPRAFRGYKVKEVRAYLARLAEAMEALLEENQRLRDALKEKEEELARLKEAEGELKRAVIAAQRIGHELKAQAEREAELILKEAKAAKDEVLKEAAEELKRLRMEAEQVQMERNLFIDQFRGLLQGYLESLRRLEEKFPGGRGGKGPTP